MSNDNEIKIKTNLKDITDGMREIAANAKNKKYILRQLAHTIVSYIFDAFESEGELITGKKWQGWSDYYSEVRAKENKGDGQILTLSAQLKESIDDEIRGDSVVVGTNMAYAAIHNFGYDDDVTSKTKSSIYIWLSVKTDMVLLL